MNHQKIDYDAIAQERHERIERESERQSISPSDVGDVASVLQQAEAVAPGQISNDHIMQFFAYDHLPRHLQEVSMPFAELANVIVARSPKNPERTVALRKLLESKDAAVRAVIAKQ